MSVVSNSTLSPKICMSQKDETDSLLPKWLSEHADAIEQLSHTDAELEELLDDHACLVKAIRYWAGKSPEKVEEFQYLAKELENEISEKLLGQRYE